MRQYIYSGGEFLDNYSKTDVDNWLKNQLQNHAMKLKQITQKYEELVSGIKTLEKNISDKRRTITNILEDVEGYSVVEIEKLFEKIMEMKKNDS